MNSDWTTLCETKVRLPSDPHPKSSPWSLWLAFAGNAARWTLLYLGVPKNSKGIDSMGLVEGHVEHCQHGDHWPNWVLFSILLFLTANHFGMLTRQSSNTFGMGWLNLAMADWCFGRTWLTTSEAIFQRKRATSARDCWSPLAVLICN